MSRWTVLVVTSRSVARDRRLGLASLPEDGEDMLEALERRPGVKGGRGMVHHDAFAGGSVRDGETRLVPK